MLDYYFYDKIDFSKQKNPIDMLKNVSEVLHKETLDNFLEDKFLVDKVKTRFVAAVRNTIKLLRDHRLSEKRFSNEKIEKLIAKYGNYSQLIVTFLAEEKYIKFLEDVGRKRKKMSFPVEAYAVLTELLFREISVKHKKLKNVYEKYVISKEGIEVDQKDAIVYYSGKLKQLMAKCFLDMDLVYLLLNNVQYIEDTLNLLKKNWDTRDVLVQLVTRENIQFSDPVYLATNISDKFKQIKREKEIEKRKVKPTQPVVTPKFKLPGFFGEIPEPSEFLFDDLFVLFHGREKEFVDPNDLDEYFEKNIRSFEGTFPELEFQEPLLEKEVVDVKQARDVQEKLNSLLILYQDEVMNQVKRDYFLKKSSHERTQFLWNLILDFYKNHYKSLNAIPIGVEFKSHLDSEVFKNHADAILNGFGNVMEWIKRFDQAKSLDFSYILLIFEQFKVLCESVGPKVKLVFETVPNDISIEVDYYIIKNFTRTDLLNILQEKLIKSELKPIIPIDDIVTSSNLSYTKTDFIVAIHDIVKFYENNTLLLPTIAERDEDEELLKTDVMIIENTRDINRQTIPIANIPGKTQFESRIIAWRTDMNSRLQKRDSKINLYKEVSAMLSAFEFFIRFSLKNMLSHITVITRTKPKPNILGQIEASQDIRMKIGRGIYENLAGFREKAILFQSEFEMLDLTPQVFEFLKYWVLFQFTKKTGDVKEQTVVVQQKLIPMIRDVEFLGELNVFSQRYGPNDLAFLLDEAFTIENEVLKVYKSVFFETTSRRSASEMSKDKYNRLLRNRVKTLLDNVCRSLLRGIIGRERQSELRLDIAKPQQVRYPIFQDRKIADMKSFFRLEGFMLKTLKDRVESSFWRKNKAEFFFRCLELYLINIVDRQIARFSFKIIRGVHYPAAFTYFKSFFYAMALILEISQKERDILRRFFTIHEGAISYATIISNFYVALISLENLLKDGKKLTFHSIFAGQEVKKTMKDLFDTCMIYLKHDSPSQLQNTPRFILAIEFLISLFSKNSTFIAGPDKRKKYPGISKHYFVNHKDFFRDLIWILYEIG